MSFPSLLPFDSSVVVHTKTPQCSQQEPLSPYREALKRRIEASKKRCLDQKNLTLSTDDPKSPSRLPLTPSPSPSPSEKTTDPMNEFKEIEQEIRKNLFLCQLSQAQILSQGPDKEGIASSAPLQKKGFSLSSLAFAFSLFFQNMSERIQQIWLRVMKELKKIFF